MAGRVIWTLRARDDKRSIFRYWNQRNRSKAYSLKLNRLFSEAIKLLKDHPYIGRKTQFGNVLVKVVRDYLIVYEVRADDIVIITIWDGRRDPDKMF